MNSKISDQGTMLVGANGNDNIEEDSYNNKRKRSEEEEHRSSRSRQSSV
jgi:hypothetical protein